MSEVFNKHYIRIDGSNNIIYGFSDAFEQPQSNDICINEKGGRQFELIDKINPNLANAQGIYLFKYINNAITPKTQEEINLEMALISVPIPSPTQNERLATIENQNAQIVFALVEGGLM